MTRTIVWHVEAATGVIIVPDGASPEQIWATAKAEMLATAEMGWDDATDQPAAVPASLEGG